VPELPEVETVCRGLVPHLTGAHINNVTLNRSNLRFAFPDQFAKMLTGQRIETVTRRAKYILMPLSGGDSLLCHLGMTGNFRIEDQPHTALQKHDHVVFDLTHDNHGAFVLIYSDPRRFGFMDIVRATIPSPFLSHLGPEPLGNALNDIDLAHAFAGRRTKIKSALLDQTLIAGLGNIYVCEALWRAGIAPTTPTLALVTKDGAPTKALSHLVRHIKDVLVAALEAGGSTLKDFKNPTGDSGYFQHNFDVYGREGAPCNAVGCREMIVRIVQSGRSSFYCPACQPEMTSETG
jgi:formamidopyrimidine-DNA glycosylase